MFREQPARAGKHCIKFITIALCVCDAESKNKEETKGKKKAGICVKVTSMSRSSLRTQPATKSVCPIADSE